MMAFSKINHQFVMFLGILVSLLLALHLVSASDTPNDDGNQAGAQTAEEEFVAWLNYIRWSVDNEPHFRQFFHRSTNTSTIVVDWSGQGNFTSVQKAVDAVPLGNRNPVYILVKAGTYREKVEIPIGKDFITLHGEGRASTVIVWNDTAGGVNSTYMSASVGVDAQYFAAMNITFQNSAPAQQPGAEREQAVAIRISGDNAVFYGCGFLGHQDTLYDQKGEHYYRDCYMEGSIDFIFGNGRSLYQGCELHVVPITPGSLTAQKRARNDSESGFAFLNCTITGSGDVYLGRAWGRYSRVVFLYTYMGNIIMPQGWNNWGDARRNETVYYGEYKCYGPGAGANGREPWAHELTDQEAQPFLTLDFIQGSSWVPLVMPNLNI